MLLFSLDVKFQVYEKICTKLLLINFNNVYGCILLVWTWVLYKGEYFCEHGMTGRISIARGHWNLVPLIFKNVSHVDFLLSSDSDAAAIPFRTFLRTVGAHRAAALCHGLTRGFSFPHPTRNARAGAGAGAERCCCALWGLCSAGRVLCWGEGASLESHLLNGCSAKGARRYSPPSRGGCWLVYEVRWRLGRPGVSTAWTCALPSSALALVLWWALTIC